VLIVCEGSKSEPLYLDDLAKSLNLTATTRISRTVQDVNIDGSGDSTPDKVAEHGIRLNEQNPDAFDEIYFVIDQDEHTTYDAALNEINQFAETKEEQGKIVAAITSVPCFEIWYLLHFKCSSKSYARAGNKSPCDCVQVELKKLKGFAKYKKGKKGYFQELEEQLSQAECNARSLLKQSCTAGEILHQGNPSTQMHKLVAALRKVAEHNN
jgi:hypothetical protein